MNAINLLPFFTLILTSLTAGQNEIAGTVTAVFDGNTFELTTPENEHYSVVLEGIDCPELTQDYGPEAKAVLEDLVLHRKLAIIISGKDRFKNYIAVVVLPDHTDPRLVLLREGLSWTREKDPDPVLEAMRVDAAAKKVGLWRQDNPTPPWIHRRELSMREAKSR